MNARWAGRVPTVEPGNAPGHDEEDIVRTRTRLAAAGTLVAALVLTPSVAVAGDRHGDRGGQDRHGQRAVGLVDGTALVTFSVSRPGAVKHTGTITGLQQDTRIVGIDARVQDRQVYGVGDQGGLYVLDAHSAKATFVQRLTTALEGTSFGVDFNPAANALRVVSDTGQNLRQPLATPGAATVVDAPLTTPPTAGTTTGVSAAAYTNNDLDAATGTTLFVLRAATDAAPASVNLQSPANAGTLALTGQLGFDVRGDVGLDITGTTGYVVVPDGRGGSTVHELSVLTGESAERGHVRAAVSDIALQLR